MSPSLAKNLQAGHNTNTHCQRNWEMASHKAIKWCWLLVDMSGWSKQEHDVHYRVKLCDVKLLIDNKWLFDAQYDYELHMYKINIILLLSSLYFIFNLQFTALTTTLGPSPRIFMLQWQISAARRGAEHEDFSDEKEPQRSDHGTETHFLNNKATHSNIHFILSPNHQNTSIPFFEIFWFMLQCS